MAAIIAQLTRAKRERANKKTYEPNKVGFIKRNETNFLMFLGGVFFNPFNLYFVRQIEGKIVRIILVHV